jgi:DNA-binding FadR family transcriptional regulator
MRRLEPSTLSRGILTELAHYVQESGLKVGDKLPPEREIGLRLGVSRPLVREALERWAALGVVEKINGRGTFLRAAIAPGSEHLIVTLHPAQEASERQTLLRTLEVRRALETEAAALAAQRATPEQIDHLEALLAQVEEAYRRVGDAPNEDWAFHQALYQASGNPLFGQLIEGMMGLFHRFWENPLHRPDFARRGLSYHRTLLDCLHAHDPEGAREAVLQILNVLQAEIEA